MYICSMENSYKKARKIFFSLEANSLPVEIPKDDYGLQVRNSLYALVRRHPGRIIKTKVIDGKIIIKRFL